MELAERHKKLVKSEESQKKTTSLTNTFGFLRRRLAGQQKVNSYK